MSQLLEISRARKWSEPVYEVVGEYGPPHLRNFLMRVVLNGVGYQPETASPNKKAAKAAASLVCLKSLGLISQ